MSADSVPSSNGGEDAGVARPLGVAVVAVLFGVCAILALANLRRVDWTAPLGFIGAIGVGVLGLMFSVIGVALWRLQRRGLMGAFALSGLFGLVFFSSARSSGTNPAEWLKVVAVIAVAAYLALPSVRRSFRSK